LNEQKPVRPVWLLPVGYLHPLWWIGIGAGLIWTDYVLGPQAQFPVIYVIPVMVAAWYSGRWAALALAIAMPLIHGTLLLFLWKAPGDLFTVLAPTIFRGAVIIVMALWFSRLAEHERKVHRYVDRLEGLLPICSFCKSIRNQAGTWESLETFISNRSKAEFTHTFCENCGKTYYPDFHLESAPPADKNERVGAPK
jgi:hypothetical protein